MRGYTSEIEGRSGVCPGILRGLGGFLNGCCGRCGAMDRDGVFLCISAAHICGGGEVPCFAGVEERSSGLRVWGSSKTSRGRSCYNEQLFLLLQLSSSPLCLMLVTKNLTPLKVGYAFCITQSGILRHMGKAVLYVNNDKGILAKFSPLSWLIPYVFVSSRSTWKSRAHDVQQTNSSEMHR